MYSLMNKASVNEHKHSFSSRDCQPNTDSQSVFRMSPTQQPPIAEQNKFILIIYLAKMSCIYLVCYFLNLFIVIYIISVMLNNVFNDKIDHFVRIV